MCPWKRVKSSRRRRPGCRRRRRPAPRRERSYDAVFDQQAGADVAGAVDLHFKQGMGRDVAHRMLIEVAHANAGTEQTQQGSRLRCIDRSKTLISSLAFACTRSSRAMSRFNPVCSVAGPGSWSRHCYAAHRLSASPLQTSNRWTITRPSDAASIRLRPVYRFRHRSTPRYRSRAPVPARPCRAPRPRRPPHHGPLAPTPRFRRGRTPGDRPVPARHSRRDVR